MSLGPYIDKTWAASSRAVQKSHYAQSVLRPRAGDSRAARRR
jgi:hypothetical protein